MSCIRLVLCFERKLEKTIDFQLIQQPMKSSDEATYYAEVDAQALLKKDYESLKVKKVQQLVEKLLYGKCYKE